MDGRISKSTHLSQCWSLVRAFSYPWFRIVLIVSRHGSEIAHVFGLPQGISKTIPATEAQISVSQVMNKAWAEFAKRPDVGLVEYGWSRYLGSKINQTLGRSYCFQIVPVSVRSTKPRTDQNHPASLIVLAKNNGSGFTVEAPEPYDVDCSRLTNNKPGQTWRA